ncbi:MAG: phosphatidylglycerophosphatase A [Candidatus Cloacimonetes bacterium]|nr:phosphatidylglycerophosphatase A [Candidatus Cloacimonadota bacterium]
MPRIPGTAATLITACILYLVPVANYSFLLTGKGYLFFTFAALLISVILMTITEKELGKDDRRIVLDEAWGYLVSIMFLKKSLIIMISAFVLFRFFDIIKPFPVNLLQRLPGGWGIVSDDIMAGLYTNILLHLLLSVIHFQ